MAFYVFRIRDLLGIVDLLTQGIEHRVGADLATVEADKDAIHAAVEHDVFKVGLQLVEQAVDLAVISFPQRSALT